MRGGGADETGREFDCLGCSMACTLICFKSRDKALAHDLTKRRGAKHLHAQM
jgi:hypothetical protein